MVVSSSIFEGKIEKLVDESLRQIKKIKVKRFKQDIKFSRTLPNREVSYTPISRDSQNNKKVTVSIPFNPLEPLYKKKFNKNDYLYTDTLIEVENPIEYILLTFHPETKDVPCEPFIDMYGYTINSVKEFGIKCYMGVVYQSDNVTKNKVTYLLEKYYGMVIYDFNKIDLFEYKYKANPNLFNEIKSAVETAYTFNLLNDHNKEEIKNIFLRFSSLYEVNEKKDEVVTAINILLESYKKVKATTNFLEKSFKKLNYHFLYPSDKKRIDAIVKKQFTKQRGVREFKEFVASKIAVENVKAILEEANIGNTLNDYFFQYDEGTIIDIESSSKNKNVNQTELYINNHFKKSIDVPQEKIDEELKNIKKSLYIYYKGMDYEPSKESKILYSFIIKHIRYTNLYRFENSFGLNHQSLDGFKTVYGALSKNRISTIETPSHEDTISLLEEVSSMRENQIKERVFEFKNYYETSKENSTNNEILQFLSNDKTLKLLAQKSVDDSLSLIHQETSQRITKGLGALPKTIEELEENHEIHEYFENTSYEEQITQHLVYLIEKYL